MASDKKELLKRAKDCFKLVSDAEASQREREKEDLSFQIPENQWDENAKKVRAPGTAGGIATPARPMISVSLLSQPQQLIYNQAAQAHLGVEIHPVSETADQEVAEVKQGLYRRIERDSNANEARLWALDRAIKCGRGWYRVNTQYDEDGDNPFDQEIVIERILNQAMVYVDPAAQKQDFSDARWGIVGAYVPLSQFKQDYPKAQAPTEESQWKEWSDSEPKWIHGEGDNKAVLVVEYFYKETEYKEATSGKGEGQIKRNIAMDKVRWCKLTAKEVLEEQDWNGRYIPLIPAIGVELQPWDGERRWEGIVRPSMDGQRVFNYAASSLVEAMSLEPKAPFIGAEGQFEGHEEEWGQANTRNLPYLEYKPVSLDGTMAPPPQRAQVDGSRMQLALMAMAQAKELVQSGTAIHEPSLGELPKRREAQSGRALLALQQQGDAGTGHYIQKMASVSIMYEARVTLDLMPAIYDRPGRVTQILGGEDEPSTIMLGKPYMQGPDGRPQALPPQPQGAPMPPGAKMFDLSKGKYAISVSVGKSYQTRLQEGQSEIGEVLQAQPNLMPLIGATYFNYRDFPGAKEIAKILRKMRDQQFPGLADEPGQQKDAEALESENQALKMKLQEQGKQLEQAAKMLETDKAKQEATLQKAQIDAQSDQQKGATDAAVKQEVARIQQETQLAIEKMKIEAQLVIEQIKMASQAAQGAAQRQHDERSEALGMQNEDRQRQAGETHDASMAVINQPAPEAPPFPEFTDSADIPLDQG
jgi:hypothetical protein